MKILSRIEGDESKLAIDFDDPRLKDIPSENLTVNNDINVLSCLKAIILQQLTDAPVSIGKINEMIKVFHRDHFVSYWG